MEDYLDLREGRFAASDLDRVRCAPAEGARVQEEQMLVEYLSSLLRVHGSQQMAVKKLMEVRSITRF